MKTKEIDTDVLIIGGGNAGCMAAINASEHGVKVTIVEKAALERSGCSSAGQDDHLCWVPGRGYSLEDVVKAHTKNVDGWVDQERLYILYKEGFDRAMDMEKWGVKIRDDEGNLRWTMEAHSDPYKSSLWIEGYNIKQVLAAQIRKRGVEVVEKNMVTSLLTKDGRVVGATGLNCLKEEFIIFKSKATVLTTGGATRLYPTMSGLPFATWCCPIITGDGYSMAFRAGAELINMEAPFDWMGTGNFNPGSPGLWLESGGGEFDKDGKPVGYSEEHGYKREKGVTRWDGARLRIEAIKKGRAPFWLDATRAPKELEERFELMGKIESPMLGEYLKSIGYDMRKDVFEMPPLEMEWDLRDGRSGLLIGVEGKTSLEGLYAAGDVTGGVFEGGNPNAQVFGWRAGAAAAEYASEAEEPVIDEEQVERERKRVYAPLQRKEGVRWMEIQQAIYNVTMAYLRYVRWEAGLDRALEKVEELRNKWIPQLVAEDAHELMRCLEVQSLIDTAEMVIKASRERRESRFLPYHYRVDYPERDDKNWRKWLVVKRDPVTGRVELSTIPLSRYRIFKEE